MNAIEQTHPSREDLAEFNSGKLGTAESTEIELHLAGCDSCCEMLTSLPDDTLVSLLREAETDPAIGSGEDGPLPGESMTVTPPLEQPTRQIARFVA